MHETFRLSQAEMFRASRNLSRGFLTISIFYCALFCRKVQLLLFHGAALWRLLRVNMSNSKTVYDIETVCSQFFFSNFQFFYTFQTIVKYLGVVFLDVFNLVVIRISWQLSKSMNLNYTKKTTGYETQIVLNKVHLKLFMRDELLSTKEHLTASRTKAKG